MVERTLSFGDIVSVEGEDATRRDIVLRLGETEVTTTQLFGYPDEPYCYMRNVGGVPAFKLNPTGQRLTTIEIQEAFRKGLTDGTAEDLNQIERLPSFFPETSKTFTW